MADNTAMGTGRHTAAKAALVLGLLIWGAIGNPDLIPPAIAQPATLTKKQSDALDSYTKAVKNFELVLSQRRAQIDSRQSLPNLRPTGRHRSINRAPIKPKSFGPASLSRSAISYLL